MCAVFFVVEQTVCSISCVKVWAAGRNRAQQAISLYANLDYLRPYFDVEPREVAQRYAVIVDAFDCDDFLFLWILV